MAPYYIIGHMTMTDCAVCFDGLLALCGMVWVVINNPWRKS
jgi:hypothetical protein